VLPAGWVKTVTTAGPAQPPPGAFGARTGYGAQWWLFGEAQGLPEDAYAAQGNRGQYVMVIPSRRVVIVRRGFDGGGESFDMPRFTADVLETLPTPGGREPLARAVRKPWPYGRCGWLRKGLTTP
jgi:CubicO group peptidase (beta-lactamase class C family)